MPYLRNHKNTCLQSKIKPQAPQESCIWHQKTCILPIILPVFSCELTRAGFTTYSTLSLTSKKTSNRKVQRKIETLSLSCFFSVVKLVLNSVISFIFFFHLPRFLANSRKSCALAPSMLQKCVLTVKVR